MFSEPHIHYRSRNETTCIILHDSHTPASMQQQGVDYLLVQGRTMGLLTIGYNFVVERNGECIETRPFDTMGSHTAGRNHVSIGICLIGGLGTDGAPEDNFTGEQVVALRKLVRNIHRLYPGIPLHGHSEVHHFKHGGCCPVGIEDLRASVLNTSEEDFMDFAR